MMGELRCQDEGEEGKMEGILSSIRSLMETMNLTIEQAMTALQVAETNRSQYTALLSNP